MGETTEIAWTDATFNPWIGCARVSPGCEHCYAEADSKRRGWAEWGIHGTRKMMSEAYWKQPLKWNRQAERDGKRLRVFCASLADVFEDRPELVAPRNRLRKLITQTPHLDWLLLTKRPEKADALWAAASVATWEQGSSIAWEPGTGNVGWPANVWLGTTVEDQRRANERIPHLLMVPASVRFLSCEPMLEAVNIFGVPAPDDTGPVGPGWFQRAVMQRTDYGTGVEYDRELDAGIDWIIVGGESGHGARPFDYEWARSIIRQCREAGVAPFVKQLGARPRSSLVHPFDIVLKNRKGGDMAEWPEDLRVREFPKAAAQ